VPTRRAPIDLPTSAGRVSSEAGVWLELGASLDVEVTIGDRVRVAVHLEDIRTRGFVPARALVGLPTVARGAAGAGAGSSGGGCGSGSRLPPVRVCTTIAMARPWV
jgi:hypothetical protein